MDDKEGMSINEFFHQLDVLVEPIVKLSLLSKYGEHIILRKKKVKGFTESKTPKWKRRRKGEKRDSDKWDYGEKL